MTALPPRALSALTLQYIGSDGAVSGVQDEFVVGSLVVVDRPNLPGQMGVRVNSVACEGRFSIDSGFETDVILLLGVNPCRVELVGTHPVGTMEHASGTATILAQLPLGSHLTVQPIGPGILLPAQQVAADESGAATFPGLPAGHYQISVVVNGVTGTTFEIVLKPNEERVLDLSVPSASHPPTSSA